MMSTARIRAGSILRESMTQASQLSPELARGLLQLARALLAAARNWTLYPPEHPTVAASVTRLSDAIRQSTLGAWDQDPNLPPRTVARFGAESHNFQAKTLDFHVDGDVGIGDLVFASTYWSLPTRQQDEYSQYMENYQGGAQEGPSGPSNDPVGMVSHGRLIGPSSGPLESYRTPGAVFLGSHPNRRTVNVMSTRPKSSASKNCWTPNDRPSMKDEATLLDLENLHVRFHTRTVWSEPPETSRRPSGEKARSRTCP
jgi:hypothetical protein